MHSFIHSSAASGLDIVEGGRGKRDGRAGEGGMGGGGLFS